MFSAKGKEPYIGLEVETHTPRIVKHVEASRDEGEPYSHSGKEETVSDSKDQREKKEKERPFLPATLGAVD